MSNKEYWIFIDDSGKLYHKNNYTIYTAIIFDSKKDYLSFKNDFLIKLKEINGGIEIKGSKFWSKISEKNKEKIISLFKKHNNIKIFSFVFDVPKLKYNFKNDKQCESILNKGIAMLCDNICQKLNIINSKIILKIDEQSRIYFNTENNNSIENYLNFPSPILLSLKKLRNKYISFEVDDKHISSTCAGIMMADILANAVHRIHNKQKEKNKILKFLQDTGNINITTNIFLWPNY